MNTSMTYEEFIESKKVAAPELGFEPVEPIHSVLFAFQRDIVRWALRRGRAAIFAAFGLGKTLIQLEIARQVCLKTGGRFLIVTPLGVRQEFHRDAKLIGVDPKFVRTDAEIDAPGIYLTNYESVREGKITPTLFVGASLDEASVLRGFGGTKTFRELMATFAGDDRRDMSNHVTREQVRYRFVATATPSPNEFIELLSYSAYLDVMDVSAAKTRFFKRNSEKADQLTIHEHKTREFWLWVSTWAVFVTKPSDIDPAYSDEGYVLPELDVRWHELPSDHRNAGQERDGQLRLVQDSAIGVQNAAREKRDSLIARIERVRTLRLEDLGASRIIWHDLESERKALEAAFPDVRTVYGSQDLEDREKLVIGFSDGEFGELAGKPSMLGSGCNFQRHCSWAIFMGIGFKFNDFIQSIHRIHRFLQPRRVRIDLIYTEAEREVRRTLERKWSQHNELVAQMTNIVREFGLGSHATHADMRETHVDRYEVVTEHTKLVHNDCVRETRTMEANSIGLILTSIPFSTQYEYSPHYADFGHTDTNEHFWEQMGYLIPELLRVLKPGRIAAIHVKDRIVPGGMTGLGFQTVYPFHADTIRHFCAHGFAFLGMKTIVTDVVRENNQTYRLGWTEQCKDGSKMGVGMPEYLMIFRKPPTDNANAYADEPVVKSKGVYTRGRWQLDAHGFARSSGNRLLAPEDLEGIPHNMMYRLHRDHSLANVYDFDQHVKLCESIDARGALPVTFMLLPPQSWHPDVWTDVARMRTLNMTQATQNRVMHLCLARGSLVLTRRGYVQIQDVAVGDEVLTHKGRWRKVLVARCTGIMPVAMLRAQGVPGLTLTPDHNVWTRLVRDTAWGRAHSRVDAKNATPCWTEASKTVGSYVNAKLPPVESPEITDPLHWWVVGRWLADGSMTAHGGAVIACGRHRIDDLLSKLGRFGGNPAHDTGTCAQILLRDSDRVLRRTLAECGQYAHGKHLPPVAFTLPREQASELLAGYLSGDGHYDENRRRWTASSASRELLLGIALLVHRVHDVIASVHHGRGERDCVIEGRTVRALPEWVLSFDLPGGRRKGSFVLDDGAWKRVRSVAVAGEVETWNLRVEEDESYTAEGCIVKNCPMQFDIADRAITQWTQEGETVLDPFGGLMTVPFCAVKLHRRAIGIELSRTYFADGANYVHAAEKNLDTPTLFDLDAIAGDPSEAEAAS